MKLATLCYVRKEGRTLMLHRIKKHHDIHKGKWNGLGGKLIEGETPQECAVREIFEESGLHAKNPILKGFLTFPQFDGFETWYVFLFLITEFEGELIDSPEGNLVWIDNDKLYELNIWEGDRIFMEWLDGEMIFMGKFIYEEGKLSEYSIQEI